VKALRVSHAFKDCALQTLRAFIMLSDGINTIKDGLIQSLTLHMNRWRLERPLLHSRREILNLAKMWHWESTRYKSPYLLVE